MSGNPRREEKRGQDFPLCVRKIMGCSLGAGPFKVPSHSNEKSHFPVGETERRNTFFHDVLENKEG
jgi:hypothetical protein